MTLFFFSHLIQTFLLPPGLNIFLLSIGFISICYSKVIGYAFVSLGFISLWFLSTPMIAMLLIKPLQKNNPVLDVAKIPKDNTSAIVVLGGGHGFASEYETNYSVSEATLNRLSYAAYLFEKTNFPIVVSGGANSAEVYAEADLMNDALVKKFHIPAAWKESRSVNTADEAKFTLPILEAHNIKTIYLVTNAWHMPRSMRVFRSIFIKSGIKVIPAPMGFSNFENRLESCLPSLDGLQISTCALHEYIGMLWYSVYYRFSL